MTPLLHSYLLTCIDMQGLHTYGWVLPVKEVSEDIDYIYRETWVGVAICDVKPTKWVWPNGWT